MKFILNGTVVTFNAQNDILDDGYVCVNNKKIEAITTARNEIPESFKDVPVVNTGGYIYPGLIDLHNHLPYNFLKLWVFDTKKPFKSRYEWPRKKGYELEISLPTNLLAITSAVELVKYCEVKSLIGGVTTIDGFSKFKGAYAAWLLRNVEVEPFGKDEPPIFQSVQLLKSDEFQTYADKISGANAFLYHLAEGTDKALEKEYTDLSVHSLVNDKLVAIHSTALKSRHFVEFGKRNVRMVWSPLSNFLLYGSTAKVRLAKKNGVLICLGPDWTPTGSKNLLWELKVADLVNKKALRKLFSDKDLVDMVIINPAKAIRWDDRIGRLIPGYLADLLVIERLHKNPYRNLIKATEKNIQLVAIEGRPRFGDPKILNQLGIQNCETIQIGSITKGIDILEPDVSFGEITLQQVRTRLAESLKDPKKTARDYKNRAKKIGAKAMPPQLLIEEISAFSSKPPIARKTAQDFLDQVINLKDDDLKAFPKEIDSLTIYEDTASFIQTLKNNKNAPKYLQDLQKIFKE